MVTEGNESANYEKVSMFGREFRLRTQLFINNQFVDAISKKKFDVICPINEKLITQVAEADKQDVDVAVQAARAALNGPWKSLQPFERGQLLNKLADLLEENADRLAEVEVLDNGKPLSEAKNADLRMTVKCFRYYAGWVDKLTGHTIPTNDGWFVYTVHEPVGVVGQIIPWNFPLLMAAWKLGPALCTGNTVVLKPAEQTPLTALLLGDLIKQAGFPPGVVNIVPGFGPIAGSAIASHMNIDKVAFTGSIATGKKVQAMAANSNLKSCTLELGGKSPNIIMDDADLDAAAQWSKASIFFNQGEVCTAGSRMFVQEGVYDKFVAKMAEAAKSIVVGNPFDMKTGMGSQVSDVQFSKILGYIESGQSEGATLVTGGARSGEEGYFIQPTIFKDVKSTSKIFNEEIFGPVLSIIPFKTEEEVVKKANLTDYGLAAAIFTKDLKRVHTLVRKLHAGTVWVNGYHNYHEAAPFGGVKQSGIGREKGRESLLNYLETKTVMVWVGLD